MKRRKNSFILSLCLLTSLVLAAPETPSVELASDWEKSEARPYFLTHEEFFAVPLAHPPITTLREEINKLRRLTLQHKNEAHLTVIGVNDWRVLKQRLIMDEVEKLAIKNKVLHFPVQALCLAQVQTVIKDKQNSTWVLSVEVPQLRQFRRDVWRLYMTKGGQAEDWDWETWSPAVVVGFTSPVLFDEDVAERETFVCEYRIKLKS